PLSLGVAGKLRITEVMYNPGETSNDGGFDNDEFEFVELKNISDESLDLSGVSFTEGVTFAFAGSDIVTLEPGAFVLVVRNREAFALRYGAQAAARVAGQYEGKLANEGEYVKVVDFWSGTIAAFEYQDAADWPTLADGSGYSLVPLETALPGEPTGSLNEGSNWRASAEIGGSPGRDDASL
ncbi:MAG: lamin tail domain-containing protein, partial [Solirubrobacterales bacterium]